MKTAIKINLVMSIVLASFALMAFIGVCAGAWWHIYTFAACVAMSWVCIINRDEYGDNALRYVIFFYKKHFKK
jgi:hypothetical protein